MANNTMLKPVAISAHLAPSHASYHGPELIWATGHLMSLDHSFATSYGTCFSAVI